MLPGWKAKKNICLRQLSSYFVNNAEKVSFLKLKIFFLEGTGAKAFYKKEKIIKQWSFVSDK